MTGLDNHARPPGSRRPGRRTVMLLLAAAALVAAAAVSPVVSRAETPPVSRAQTPPDYPPPHWIIQENALQSLDNPKLAGGLSQLQLQQLFGNQRSYIDYLTTRGTHTVKGAVSVYSASSEQKLAWVLQHNELPYGTDAVLFDIERWKYTYPADEQQHPNPFITMAAADVRAYNAVPGHHHLLFIAAPAPDLTTSALPSWKKGNYAGYLYLQLAATAARVSDVLDIQGQQIENTDTNYLSDYVSFVAAAAAQARKANPHVIILAGLTTTPKKPITANQLKQIYCAERGLDGYWLNIAAGTDGIALPLLRQVLAFDGNGCPSAG